MSITRTETDSFGPLEVPADSYWGAQTERSVSTFPFGTTERMPVDIVHALGFVKQAAARVNARIGGLDPQLAEAIQQAAGEVARGDLDGQFPLVIWQTGRGTQSNMNATETIARRAHEVVAGPRGGKARVPPQAHHTSGPSRHRWACGAPGGVRRSPDGSSPLSTRATFTALRWRCRGKRLRASDRYKEEAGFSPVGAGPKPP